MPGRRAPAGPSYRGKQLAGSQRSFRAALEQLEADTVPATYAAKVIASALSEPDLADALATVRGGLGAVEILADALATVRGGLGAVEILAAHRTRPQSQRSA